MAQCAEDQVARGLVETDSPLERRLKRRQRRFERYLRLRGWLGLALIAHGLVALAAAAAILGHAVGWWAIAEVSRWTHGFDAVLAVFLPSALGFLLVRSGWTFWRSRRSTDDDTGCLVS